MTKKPFFTRGHGVVYGLVRHPEEHARALRHGLDILGPSYVCEPCSMCKGTGLKPDRFGCSYCEGTGLTQDFDRAATDSQRHQVLRAASMSMLLDFEVKVL